MISPSRVRIIQQATLRPGEPLETLVDDRFRLFFSMLPEQTSAMTPVIMALHGTLPGITVSSRALAIRGVFGWKGTVARPYDQSDQEEGAQEI